MLKRKCMICNEEKEITFFDMCDAYYHRKQCRECYNKLKRDKRDKKRNENFIKGNLLECKICGKFLRHINNTHLKRHGLTITEYKEKFGPEIFTQDLLKEQNLNREKTIGERYTEEEIKFLKGEFSKRKIEEKHNVSRHDFYVDAWNKKTKEEREGMVERFSINKKKFLEEIKKDPIKYKRYKLKKEKTRIKTNLEKYNVPFPQQLPEVIKKALETRKKRHGTLGSTQKTKQTLFAKYKKYSNFYPRYSLNSQELFVSIAERTNANCIFATCHDKIRLRLSEFQVYNKTEHKVRFLDFYIPELKFWIEFDEKHHRYTKIKLEDIERERQIKEVIPDIILLRVKESIWLEDPAFVCSQICGYIAALKSLKK